MTWGTAGQGTLTVKTNGTFSGSGYSEWCVYNGQNLPYYPSTGMCLYNGSMYPVTTPGASKQRANYTFVGAVSEAGQLTGTWSSATGESGGFNGAPNGSGLRGSITTAGGGADTWYGS